MSVLEYLVRKPFLHDCKKHELAPDAEKFADERINAMTNAEFLEALSHGLDEFYKLTGIAKL